MEVSHFRRKLPKSAFAFRGYNTTNLGRSHELLLHPAYGPVVRACLKEASLVCGDVISKRVDLTARVRQRRETTLRTYAEAIAIILAMEGAQIMLLREFFGVEMNSARMLMGYSLGEIAAVSLAGVFDLHDAMRVPIALAHDSAELANDVRLGVLFSRGRELPHAAVDKLCLAINQENAGAIDVSAQLSPNSFLLMGQRKTLDRFKELMTDALPGRVNLRKNDNRFPPLHTSIVWQRNIPNRAALMMQTMPGGVTAPNPPVMSLVTGKQDYNEVNARDILHRWTDHPQRLWDAVYGTLTANVDMVVHVGPEPNIIPATFKRLQDNVEVETKGKIGMRALKAVVRHPWLKTLLPSRTALLRAPGVEQLVLEDWLLSQEPE